MATTNPPIPKILHQVWLGPDPLPERFVGYRETWLNHHPNWEHRLWTEDTLPSGLQRPEAYERTRYPAERADIIRLEVLFLYGGFYADTDAECLRPVDTLLGDHTIIVPRLNSGRISNAIMASVAGHPVLERAIRELRPREFHGYDKRATGPDYVGEIVEEDPTVTVFPPEIFFPRTPAERRSAYTIHHEARSWKDAEGFRHDAELAKRRWIRTQYELDDLQRKYEETLAEAEMLRTRLAAAEARLAGVSAGGRFASRGRIVASEMNAAAVRLPHRLRATARDLRRRLRTG